MPDSVKSFQFGAKKASGVKIVGKFHVDEDDAGYEIRGLKDSAVAYLVHRTDGAPGAVILASVLDFMDHALTADSAKRFEARVLGSDGSDGLEMAQVVEVFNYVLEVVAANPTGSSTVSSGSPRRSGSRSTANSRA